MEWKFDNMYPISFENIKHFLKPRNQKPKTKSQETFFIFEWGNPPQHSDSHPCTRTMNSKQRRSSELGGNGHAKPGRAASSQGSLPWLKNWKIPKSWSCDIWIPYGSWGRSMYKTDLTFSCSSYSIFASFASFHFCWITSSRKYKPPDATAKNTWSV